MKKLLLAFIALVILAAAGGIVIASLNVREGKSPVETVTNVSKSVTASDAEKVGKDLANGKCSGTGPEKLTRSPMDPEDFGIIIPYGLMVGGHVTPIDHQYFSPKEYKSARDTYEVYAMADSRIVQISERTNQRGTEYRFVFSMTCTFLYYYDLVTSLAPDIKAEYDARKEAQRFNTELDIPVKAGQLVGRIGGQTLDFAVWDTEKPLKGFITPKLYEGERWKLYTADPLDYYAPDLKELALSRYVRAAEPISGKIDYDIDGRLIGNWFAEGSGGYAGPGGGREGYWRGHFAVAPEHYDPSAFVVSFGDFGGKEQQFVAKGNAPKPEEVSVTTGLVKYELVQWSHTKADGSPWDRMSHTRGPKLVAQDKVFGCVLLQLLENRKLKMEAFPEKECANISAFTAQAKIYER